MCALASGSRPVKSRSAFFARAAAAVVIASLGGCASNSANSTAQSAATNMRVAQTVTDVEDDGLPAQTPPTPRARQSPDDPTEPFSRNYGGTNPSASAAPLVEGPVEHHAPNPNVPNDLPAAFRQKLIAALSEDE